MTHLVTPNRGEAQPGSWLGRALLGFIDNDGAKHVLAKGGTTSLEASAVCDGVSACEIAGAVLRFLPAGNFQCTESDPCGTGASALLGPK